jgi:signal transduction histidine kinase
LNDAAAIHNRRPNTELLGKRMPDAWPGIEATRIFALLRRCMVERVALHEETEFVFPDGSTGWFDVRSQPVPEGIFVLSIDISERKQAEKALRDLNEGLERKVADRTIELEAARVRAESADRIKSAFLATMSHELRTPLNSIIGFTGMVLQGLAGPLNPEQSKQLGMVRGSARHLLELINDVLDISKIEAGQLEVRVAPFDLGASVERVAASVKPLMEKKGLTLEVTLPASLDALESDRRRVDQILLNLLQNAIKFTDRGGVTLAVEAVGDGHSSGDDAARPAVRIRVSDTGIGMHTADLAKLFQPFRQIDSGLGRQHEGTGLGLAICRRLTELLGGTIGAESVWGQGSTFTVTLPQKRAGREP